MKTALAVFLIFVIASLSAPQARAQDYMFSYFQCSPLSCVEQTLPEVVGTAFVSYNATCTGGVVGSISGSVKSQIGIDGPCPTLYVAKASVTTSTTTYLDDCGDPYDLSSFTAIAQVLTPFGTVVFNDEAGADCIGGTSGPTNNGKKPC